MWPVGIMRVGPSRRTALGRRHLPEPSFEVVQKPPHGLDADAEVESFAIPKPGVMDGDDPAVVVENRTPARARRRVEVVLQLDMVRVPTLDRPEGADDTILERGCDNKGSSPTCGPELAGEAERAGRR